MDMIDHLTQTVEKLEAENSRLRSELEKQTDSFVSNALLLNEYIRAMDQSCIISKTDPQGRILHVNDIFCEISGYSRHELLGQTHTLMTHPNMPSDIFENIRESILAKESWSGVLQYCKKNGSRYYIQSSITPVLDEQECIMEIIHICFDITYLVEKEREVERMRIKEMIQNVNQAKKIRVEEFAEMVPIPTLLSDESFLILYSNKALKNQFNLLQDDSTLELLDSGKASLTQILKLDEEVNASQFLNLLSAIGDEEVLKVTLDSILPNTFTISMHTIASLDEAESYHLIFLIPTDSEECEAVSVS